MSTSLKLNGMEFYNLCLRMTLRPVVKANLALAGMGNSSPYVIKSTSGGDVSSISPQYMVCFSIGLFHFMQYM